LTDEPAGGDDGIGCRAAVITGGTLLAGAVVVGAIGLTVALQAGSSVGLALFYAAAPVSALFGVIGGGLPVAWPLDALLWLVLGTAAVGWSARSGWHLRRILWLVVGVALAYGASLSRLVEVERVT
jgi:hypothetical protein